jgi:hypothetical protein
MSLRSIARQHHVSHTTIHHAVGPCLSIPSPPMWQSTTNPSNTKRRNYYERSNCN